MKLLLPFLLMIAGCEIQPSRKEVKFTLDEIMLYYQFGYEEGALRMCNGRYSTEQKLKDSVAFRKRFSELFDEPNNTNH